MSKKWMTPVRAKNVQFRILKSGEVGWKYERAWKKAHVSFSTNTLGKRQHIMTVEFAYGKRIDVPIADEMDKFQVQPQTGRVIITSHRKRSTFNIKEMSSNEAQLIGAFLQEIIDEKTQKTAEHLSKVPDSERRVGNSARNLQNTKSASPAYNDGPFRRNSLLSSKSTSSADGMVQTRMPAADDKENKTPAGDFKEKSADLSNATFQTPIVAESPLTPQRERPHSEVSSINKRKSSSPYNSFSKKNCPSPSGSAHDVPLPNLTPNRRKLFESTPTLTASLLAASPKTKSESKSTASITPSKESKKSQRKFDDFRRAQAEVRHANVQSENYEEKENTSPPSGSKGGKSAGISKRSFYGSSALTSSFAYEMSKVRIIHTTPSPSRKAQTPSKIQSVGNVRRSLLQDASPKKSASHKQMSENCTSQNNESELFSPPSSGVDTCERLVFDDNNNDSNKENFAFQPLSDTANFTSVEGFQNLGNTCYMNSTLQSLFGLLPFQLDLYALEKKLKSVLRMDGLLASMVRLMRRKMSTSDSEKRILLKKVKCAISASAKQFYGFSQHDAHEFLRLCLDILQEDIRKANKDHLSESNNNNNVDIQIKTKADDNFDCPVTKNFSFTVTQRIVCNKCKSITTAKDEWYDLPVELQQKPTDCVRTLHLQNLINSSFAEESIEHVCEECKSNQATVCRSIEKLPRIMMIYLKRYSYNHASDHSEKLRLPVVLPPYISFKQFCSGDIAVDTEVAVVDDECCIAIDDGSAANAAPMEVVIVTSDEETTSKPSATAPLNNNNNTVSLTDECNNNPGSLSSAQNPEVISLLSIENDKELTKALEISEREFFNSQQNQFKGIMDHEKLGSLSEEDQVLLAMELSLRNDQDASFLQTMPESSFPTTTTNNNTTNVDTNENLTTSSVVPTTNPLHENPPHHETTASEQTAPPAAPDKKSKSSDASHRSASADSEATMSFSTIGSTKLDAFLSGVDSDQEDDVVFPVFGQSKSSTNGDAAATVTPIKSTSLQTTKTANTPSLNQADERREDKIATESNAYRLVSVVSHKGGSSNVGHYVSDVLNDFPSRKWQCFNDRRVENVTESEVLLGRQSTSYLLFYLHKDFLHLYQSK